MRRQPPGLMSESAPRSRRAVPSSTRRYHPSLKCGQARAVLPVVGGGTSHRPLREGRQSLTLLRVVADARVADALAAPQHCVSLSLTGSELSGYDSRRFRDRTEGSSKSEYAAAKRRDALNRHACNRARRVAANQMVSLQPGGAAADVQRTCEPKGEQT